MVARKKLEEGAQHTFPIPVCPSVADLDDEEAGDPWYISLFFFTPGVARVVPFDNFRHLEQTMVPGQVYERVRYRLVDSDGEGMLMMFAMVVDG